MIAGLSGESGKTLVSMGLLLSAVSRGMCARAFKKGPDYIDSAWLSWASGAPARNLDTYLMGFDRVVDTFCRRGCADGFNVIEGNRGLYDGLNAQAMTAWPTTANGFSRMTPHELQQRIEERLRERKKNAR